MADVLATSCGFVEEGDMVAVVEEGAALGGGGECGGGDGVRNMKTRSSGRLMGLS